MRITFQKEIDGKGQGPMKDPEEQWLDYSISFTAEYTEKHMLFLRGGLF